MPIRRRRSAAAVLIIIASVGLTMAARSPHFEAIRNVDIVQFIAVGACLGVAFALITLKPAA